MNAPADGKTKDELLEEARERDIAGRSDMTKDELAEALDAAEDESAPSADSSRSILRPEVGSRTSTGPVPDPFAIRSPENGSPGVGTRSASRRGEKIKAMREQAKASREG